MNFSFSRFLSFLFVDEHNCVVCDRELPKPSRYRLCNKCYAMLEVIGDRACLKCGRMMVSEGDYCLDCQNHEMEFDRAFSPLAYNGAAVMMVTKLKFHNKKYLATGMANQMTDRFLEEELAADVIVPVPLHPNRQKERGYNQSELLADVIAKSLRLPLDKTSLRREKDTLASSSLQGGRSAREENLKDAFAVTGDAEVKGKTVLLVDDVLTTGTTANQATKALKNAGAKAVYVLTFASVKEKPPIQADL